MKKFFLLLLFFSSLSSFLPKPIGEDVGLPVWGDVQDYVYSIEQTTDGGFILSGNSSSGISGDKTQPVWGDYDYWIVKTDSLGNKVWDKDFGGIYSDYLYCAQQTTDGGFILGGSSNSVISGDKTQNTWGGEDYWIVKTDSLGNKEWDKDFGGSSTDILLSIQQTADGGYILGGRSTSNISGDKTQNGWGGYDQWIVKIDSLGNKEWDKDFGGTGQDWLWSLHQMNDGGYILGGNSNSNISGDKTQNTWGNDDYWIVKTDSLGNKLWDRDFGGTDDEVLFSLNQTADGGFILGGHSDSNIGGDKTQNTWGSADYWIVKIDSLGNKQWDKDFGGSAVEELYNVSQTLDGGYLISGDSYSSIGGNKTESNLGQEQTWIVKTDDLGNLQWDKTIFTPGHDENGLSIRTRDGCYVVSNGNLAFSGIGGYKTQANWGLSDYWIIKFCDTTQVPIIAFTSASNICPGTCTDFTNLSFNATSYQWSFPGAIPNTSTAVNPTNICYANPGIYDVQLIATNANGSDTLLFANYITVYPAPPAQAITQGGDTLFALAGAASYQWYFNGNIINGATDYFYIAPQSGDYYVVATDANGCEVEAAIFNVIAEVQSLVNGQRSLEVYPNPVDGEFRVYGLQFTVGRLTIFNLLGEIVYSASVNRKPETVNCKQLPAGMYYLEVSSSGKVYRSKFVKQ